MRILFDEQVFLLQKRGGISRYFTELIKIFMQHPELHVEPILNFKKSSNELILSLSQEYSLGIARISTPQPLAIAQSIAASAFRFPKVDLVHHTFYSKTFWHSGYNGPRTSTHYDMIPEIFHQRHLGINPHLSKHWYFKSVDHIFSISESAKQDLMQIWPDVETPMTVTHLGKPDISKRGSKRIQGYIIFVGARQGYKDGETLLRAFARTPERLRVRIDFLGGNKFTESERDLISKLGIDGHVTQRDVSDLELVDAYYKAHLFVFPSHYEGFGLPALEALQFGCRSLLANTPALKEVAGNCADYFTPGDVNHLTKMIVGALSDNVDKNPHFDSGMKRVDNFSWFKTAKETARIYQSLI